MRGRSIKSAIGVAAVVGLLWAALPAKGAHESRMTGGGHVDQGADPDSFRVHLGLDLPCTPVPQPPAAKESRLTVTTEEIKFHLEQLDNAHCMGNDPPNGGGEHSGDGVGRCHVPGPVPGTQLQVDAQVEWTLTDGGASPGNSAPGRPTNPGKPAANPTQNPDEIHISIAGQAGLCQLEVDGTLQGGQLQLHQQHS